MQILGHRLLMSTRFRVNVPVALAVFPKAAPGHAKSQKVLLLTLYMRDPNEQLARPVENSFWQKIADVPGKLNPTRF
jgi:hypothetical protein